MGCLPFVTPNIPHCPISQYLIIPISVPIHIQFLDGFSNDSYSYFNTFNNDKLGIFPAFDKNVTNNKHLHVENILQCVGVVV